MMTLKSISFRKSLLAALPVAFFAVACQPETTEPTDDRDKFVDVWHCIENSSQIGQTPYDVHINLSTTNESQVLIENFYNVGFGFKAFANVSGRILSLNSQTYNSSQLQGNGSMSGINNTQLVNRKRH